MSYVEMVAFNKEGQAYEFEDVTNSFRGAMAVWRIIEKKYLPMYRPSFVPDYIPDEKVEEYLGYRPSRANMAFGDGEAMREVWRCYNREDISKVDKIVLGSTFDRVLVKRENVEETIEAFLAFEGDTNLPEQAKVLKEMLSDENIIAVGWNQTSVTSNQWLQADFNEEEEEYIPYNCLTGENHFWLFDDIYAK